MPNSVKQNHKKDPQSSTQHYLRIGEIHDDTVVLKNGGIRAVLEVESVNVSLKSEEEQNSMAVGYQGFLNSLEFPVQIVTRSKKLDISGYLEKIAARQKTQQNELLKNQLVEYEEYIRRLVEYADIMEKKFFVVVPHDPYRAKTKGMWEQFWAWIHPGDNGSAAAQRKREFENLIKPLGQKVEAVQAGLENCGLKVKRLKTEELISLYYDIYNPLTARSEKVTDLAGEDLVDSAVAKAA